MLVVNEIFFGVKNTYFSLCYNYCMEKGIEKPTIKTNLKINSRNFSLYLKDHKT